jgi:PsbN protein
VIVAFTAFAVYTAFGPPAKQLADPFDEHED